MQKQVEVTVQLKFHVEEHLTVADIDSEVTMALQDVLHSTNFDIISPDTEDVTVTDVYIAKSVPVIDLDVENDLTASNESDDDSGCEDPDHPNGFENWYETHFEICYYLSSTEDTPGSMANQVETGSGRGGLYELSKKLTDEFETKFKGKVWDGDYFDEIDKFLDKQNGTFQTGS
ncbi:hypothetical protein [Parapedobacter sp. 10938]|uniref:hypothetical protein n=1 Tax=Parapedobacter flavus TaxID=3110225 RepID=UPI002DB70FF3|nr:hypothetical protein [Parapedobacter sp. 10938]MEC3881980.1 hypothetical protein [Parapedobacter sp. 10938]